MILDVPSCKRTSCFVTGPQERQERPLSPACVQAAKRPVVVQFDSLVRFSLASSSATISSVSHT